MTQIYGYWVSPDGYKTLIQDRFGHRKFAEQILNTKIESEVNTVSLMLDKGWIRIVNGQKTLMLDYKYLYSINQLTCLYDIDKELMDNGYFHESYGLSYPYGYKVFVSWKQMINYMKQKDTK